MKLPNSYGSVIKLSGNRRRPYAVRISRIENDSNGVPRRKFKYLGYFAKPELAYTFLADYNKGIVVPEHVAYNDAPTFADMYNKWKSYRKSLKNQISESAWKNYGIAFNHFSDLHDKKFISIRADDLQDCLNKYNTKSRSTISNMRALLRGMYQYAKNNDYIEKDMTEGLVFEWTQSSEAIHDRYTDEEIDLLWNKLYIINNVDIILIMIYTGLRPSELLEILTEDVHIKEKYMIGGMKTDAGIGRTIPINEKILPLIKKRYDPNSKFLINNKYGNHYTYGTYMNGNFNTCMSKLGLQHLPHDGRHTFASLMDSAGANEVCIKLIMGHSMKNDVTKGTYTHKTLEELLTEVNKI
ncbi:MAG: tyrosine-type recombinase/integrase [Eubacteriales bacterium]|nr:tyrosine-type recombinase/integrase [Eubacteriales bacterium]